MTLLGNDGDDTDPDPDALLDVVLARSECDVSFTEEEQPTTTTTVRPGSGTPTGPHASNDSNVSNHSDGTAVIGTGDATAVGNISNTEINQSADASGAPPHPCVPENPCTCTTTCTDPCPPTSPCHPCVAESPCQPCSGDPCLPCGGTCWGFWPGFGNWGGSAVSQSAHVVNAGDAQANTGGNTAVGNNSRNFASNNQTPVAAR